MRDSIITEKESQVTIKFYPGLSQEALKQGEDREIVLWYLLRSLDHEGKGWLIFKEVKKSLQDIYSRVTLSRILKSGTGKFWEEKHPGVIHFFGLAKVAKFFGISHLITPKQISIKPVQLKRYANRRAFLYSHSSFIRVKSFQKPLKPISRKSIKNITGIEKYIQRKYEKLFNIEKVENFAVRGPGDSRGLLMKVKTKSNIWDKQRQLGNSYIGKELLFAGHSLVRKVNKYLRKDLGGLKKEKGLKRFFFNYEEFQKFYFKGLPGGKDREKYRLFKEPFIAQNGGKGAKLNWWLPNPSSTPIYPQ